MRILLKTRSSIPLFRLILILLISLISTYYYLIRDILKATPPAAPTMMAMTSIQTPFSHRKIEKPPQPMIKRVSIERNQTFTDLMKEQGIDAATIHNLCLAAGEVYNLGQIHAGKEIVLTTKEDNTLDSLEYSIDPLQTLVLKKVQNGWKADLIQHDSQLQVRELGGYIYRSLYETIDKLGEEDDLVLRFAEIFEWDVDFFKDLQEGDSFRIIYEKQYVEGKPFGYGRILAAELVNKGNTYRAIGYQRGKNWEFFSPDGKAMRKAFLASPLKFTRISSGFTGRRYHPILKKYRPHYGIDYSAPAGTPVRSIGKGRVILAGWAGGAGKTIKIQHDRDITTMYCHLSRFASGIRKGVSVSQGQIIGYVGSTGLSTGPHLDFRFMKKGKYVNFLSVKSPQAEPLSAAEVTIFKQKTEPLVVRLDSIFLRTPHTEENVASLLPSSLHFKEEI